MTDNFVEEYMSECIDRGICTPKDICNRAMQRIDDIDEELLRHQALRKEKSNLEMVLRTFNHEAFKKPRKSKEPMINSEVAEADLDPSYINLLSSICGFIDQSEHSVMPREIIDRMLKNNAIEHGTVDDKQRCIYMSIKWLLDRGIIRRDEANRSLSQGKNWEDRP